MVLVATLMLMRTMNLIQTTGLTEGLECQSVCYIIWIILKDKLNLVMVRLIIF